MAKPSFLQPDERVLIKQSRHGASILDEILAIIFFAALVAGAGVVGFYLAPEAWQTMALTAGIVLATAIIVVGGISKIWRVKTSSYIVTDQRVYTSWGRLSWFMGQTTYDKLTDMHIKQSPFGRIGNFGTIRLETAGTGLVLAGVRDPHQVKQRIETARTRFLGRLLGEAPKNVNQAGDQVDAPRAAKSRSMGKPLWKGGPAASSLVGWALNGIIPIGFLLFTGAGGAIAGGGPAALIPIAIALVIGVLILLRGVIVLKYTTFSIHEGGVVIESGWLSRQRTETTWSKVTDVSMSQGILARILGYGAIQINTAGSAAAAVVFNGVGNPETVKQMIDRARGA